MADEVTEYLASLPEPRQAIVADLIERSRGIVPEVSEGLSYNMPALLYRGKGLVSVMSTKKHIGLYPFGNLAELEAPVKAAGFGTTKGSIHILEDQHFPTELLERLLLRRKAYLDR